MQVSKRQMEVWQTALSAYTHKHPGNDNLLSLSRPVWMLPFVCLSIHIYTLTSTEPKKLETYFSDLSVVFRGLGYGSSNGTLCIWECDTVCFSSCK